MLAGAAGELLAHRLHDLPLARNGLEAFGDGLAELAQPAAAARTFGRAWEHDAFARQMLGQRCAHRLASGESVDGCCLCGRRGGCILSGRGLQFLEFQFHLVEQLAATFG